MKTTFSSNSQCAHVWAQQAQAQGKGNNLFFEGDSIWSYGRHFKAARIHVVNGQRFALINSERYSVSTAKHLNIIASSLRGLMGYWYAPNVDNPKFAVKYQDELNQGVLLLQLEKKKITSETDIKDVFSHIREVFDETNRLRTLLKLKEKWPTKAQLDRIEKHLRSRLKRYQELNTPEMQAKREKERVKRGIQKLKLLEVKLDAHIKNFREKGLVGGLRDLPYDLCRIQDGCVFTSRGVAVPIDEARALFDRILSKQPIQDVEIGHFKAETVTETPDGDAIIKIGCHRILLSEAKRLFRGVA